MTEPAYQPNANAAARRDDNIAGWDALIESLQDLRSRMLRKPGASLSHPTPALCARRR